MGHPLNSSFAAVGDMTTDPAEEFESQVIGPPAYASPDPATNAGALVPVNRHNLDLSPDYGKGQGDLDGPADTMTASTEGEDDGTTNPDDKLLSADWIKEVEGATDKTALTAIRTRYDAADHKKWTTVESAFKTKTDSFND